jgi:hypothetical protein
MAYSGMAIFPFVFLKNVTLKSNKTLVYHERIHLTQQLELLIIPFYLVYLIHYVINLIKYQNHDKAYRNIVFEREAYANDSKLYYLRHRKIWSFVKYF